MNIRILEEIGQYLPNEGRILDVGCGFGLFTLYYALLSANRRFTSVDINPKRIEMARSAADILHLSARISFRLQEASMLIVPSKSYEASYIIDLIHHLPKEAHKPLICTIYDTLVPDGVLIIKDIATSPCWKVLFTWILDMVMTPRMPPHYVDTDSLVNLLVDIGFNVKTHALLDTLPYPHVLYICRKEAHRR